MNRTSLIGVALLAPWLLAASNQDIPPLLHYQFSDEYAWVSESKAFDKAGNLRTELFGPYAQSLTAHLAANHDGTCHQYMTQSSFEVPISDSTLDQISANARHIIAGRVVSITHGLYQALPGTLLTLRVSNDLTRIAKASSRPQEITFLFIPSAALVTPVGALCSRSLVPVPQIGDRVVFFDYFGPNDEQGLIHSLDPYRHLIIERESVRIYTPAHLREEISGLNVDEITRQISARRLTQR